MRSNLNILRRDAPRPEIPVRPAILAFLEATRRERTTMTQKGYRQRLLVFADYCEERGIGLPITMNTFTSLVRVAGRACLQRKEVR